MPRAWGERTLSSVEREGIRDFGKRHKSSLEEAIRLKRKVNRIIKKGRGQRGAKTGTQKRKPKQNAVTRAMDWTKGRLTRNLKINSDSWKR